MIWESRPWKDRLLTDAAIIRRWCAKNYSERQTFILEQKVMLAAYAVRKLCEARKISDSIAGSRLRVAAFPCRGTAPDLLNWHKIDRFYDFQNGTHEELPVWQLANQIIHSFVFVLSSSGESGIPIDAFLVASDHQRSKLLYQVDIQDFCSLMERVGDDYPATGRWVRDPKTSQLTIWTE
jgi:hypothetical protein